MTVEPKQYTVSQSYQQHHTRVSLKHDWTAYADG